MAASDRRLLAAAMPALGNRQRALIAAGIVCGAVGACSIAIYLIYLRRHPVQDWMVYWAAGRAYLDGNLKLIFDGSGFTAHLNRRFAGWLAEPFGFRSFIYPPPFLLLLVPFGLIGFLASAVLFQLATFAALSAAVGCFAADRRHRVLLGLSLALAPPVWFNLVTGQNGFLTGALMIGGFGVLPRRPILAGMLLGALTYKPQFWLLVPVALAAGRHWRVLAIAVATAAGLAVVSLAVFGPEPWRAWIEWAVNPPAADYRKFLECCRLHDESVFTNLTLLGMPKLAADLGQLAAAVAAAACVWRCYRRPFPGGRQLCVLLAAATLAAPHFANYDAVLLTVAATLMFAFGLDYGFRPGGAVVPLLVWAIQLFNPPDVFRVGLATPLLTALLIACAMARTSEPTGDAVEWPRAAADPTA